MYACDMGDTLRHAVPGKTEGFHVSVTTTLIETSETICIIFAGSSPLKLQLWES